MKIQKRKPTTDSEKLEKAHKALDNKTVKADPLHGVKLLDMLNYLVDKYGWFEMSKKINIRCFKFDPSIKSSLHFLRRTPWARTEVEQWYKSEH